MTAPAEPVVPAAPAQEPAAAPAAPPWGNDFDPARAWHTIQQLREIEKERDQLRPLVKTPEEQQALAEHAALVQASKTEAQRQTDAVAAAQTALAQAQSEATRYKVAATHGIPAEHFDLLGAGSEEQVTANAVKVAALLAAQAVAATVVPPAAPVTPGRLTVEQMRPGATPAGTESEDDVIYAALFGPQK